MNNGGCIVGWVYSKMKNNFRWVFDRGIFLNFDLKNNIDDEYELSITFLKSKLTVKMKFSIKDFFSKFDM